jgi:hypothetical protein
MKKITVILLLCIYSISTLGLSLKSFYCCGNLKSVTVTLSQEAHEKCSNDDGSKDCCKTKYQFFKVKDNHIAADVVSTPVLHLINLHLFTPSFQVFNYQLEENYIAHKSNAPPLLQGVPYYIYNCVFRI